MQLLQLRVPSDQRFLDQARSPSVKTKTSSPMRYRQATEISRSSPCPAPARLRAIMLCRLRCRGISRDADRLNPPAMR